VLTPNPNMSGGAMWNILGLYGAALRGHIAGVPGDDHAAAADFLSQVLTNVSVMDKSARESILNYEMGIGDLAITYENEVLVGRNSGQDYELVIPTSTILIENPIAVVDMNVEKHGNRDVAEAFVQFLYSREAQDIFARHGLRVVNPEAAAASASLYPEVEDLFTIGYFGGWDVVMEDYFGQEGIYNMVIMQVQQGE
jgi:sulfate/thiosulfate transport system substrate-binding protein